MKLNLNKISPLPESIIEFLDYLSTIDCVKRIIVFGSRANSDYEKFSDLDLAIDAPQLKKIDWLRLKEEAYYDVRTVLQISMVNFNTNPIRLQNQILITGEIIYVK